MSGSTAFSSSKGAGHDPTAVADISPLNSSDEVFKSSGSEQKAAKKKAKKAEKEKKKATKEAKKKANDDKGQSQVRRETLIQGD